MTLGQFVSKIFSPSEPTASQQSDQVADAPVTASVTTATAEDSTYLIDEKSLKFHYN